MRKLKLQLTVLLTATFLFYVSCRKSDQTRSDNPFQPASTNHVQKFFTIPAGTQPVVVAVAKELERRNNIKEFVNDFAETKGFPVWNKAILSFADNNPNNNFGNSGGSGDSLVYIPLVLQNTTSSNGFLRAVINDSISLSYCLAQDYKNYTFTPSTNITTADEFASLFMVMDKEVFGQNKFYLTDPRLLTGTGTGNGTQNRIAKILSVENGTTGNNLCEGTIYTVSWLVQDPQNCTCANGASTPGGVCQDWETGCQACSNTVTITITVGDDPGCGGTGGGGEGPIGGGNPIGGGPSGGGTGGGAPPPPYYPCQNVPTALLPEPLPPCPPPTGGSGWTQPASLLSVDASGVVDPCLQGLIQNIGQGGHTSFILKTYFNHQFNTSGTQKKYKVKYLTNTTLIGNNGQPIPGSTNVNTLPDGTNEVVITLNPSFFQNTTKEWVTSIILHELYHGMMVVERPDLNTQELQHKWMFNNLVPLTIAQSMEELFPGIDLHNAIALGMGGMSEGYIIPGTNTVDPVKDAFARQYYSQNINQAISTGTNYQNAVTGYGNSFC